MLRYHFDRLFKARGIERPFQYLRQAGFSDKLATKIKNNKVARLDLPYLEKFCLLMRCTPNDCFSWTPEPETNLETSHPMNGLRPRDIVSNLTKTLNAIPLNQLEDIEQLINEHLKPKDDP